nr:phosphate acyltransferase PlsX [Maliibacterium massiliense]
MAHVVLDAMGGDNAPGAVVAGAVEALAQMQDLSLTLVGDETAIKQCLEGAAYDANRLRIVHATQVITNEEKPVMAVRRKKDASTVVGLKMLRDGAADAFVSAGSTGAVLTASLLILGTIEGISRPALAPLIPTTGKPVMLIDCGANVDAKPHNLEQFALMGSVYMRSVERRESPRIGLVNVGVEEGKGNALAKEAFPLLQALPINFVGNVEARDVLLDAADVVVCDAFVGNVILKLSEGAAILLTKMLKEALTSKTHYKLMAAGLKGALRAFKGRMDYTKYGGAPLLGVNGCVVKAHGSSNAAAIASALRQAKGFVDGRLVPTITEEMAKVHAALAAQTDAKSAE